MAKLIIYPVGRYDIFRGKEHNETWYVYDRQEGRYVGGSFSTKKAAVAWVDAAS